MTKPLGDEAVSNPRILLRTFALTVMVGIAFSAAASAAQVHVHANDEVMDEVFDRGTHPEAWMPVLDGHVYVNAESGEVLVAYTFRPGGEEFNGPVIVTAGVGERCIQTGNPPHVKVYAFECLEQVPVPPPMQ